MVQRADDRRHALVIGINRYPKFPESMQLAGCVNDAVLMADVLEQAFGFRRRNITSLHDGEATRDGILAAMAELRERVPAEGVVVVHFSGHGSRRVTRAGNKPDGKDQTLVPHDSGRRPHRNLDIDDNYFYAWILELSQVTRAVTLIFDSCYAGGITRDAFGGSPRWAPEDDRPASEAPPRARSAGSRPAGPSGWLPLDERYLLLAGCRQDQQACELDPERHSSVTPIPQGALTFFLCQELLRAEPGATYQTVFEQVGAKVTSWFPSQHPQLEGARDRLLFGVDERPPRRFLTVQRHQQESLWLAGGAAHGVTEGSTWAIHPPGASPDATETPFKAEVRAVGAVTAEAALEETGGLPPDLTRGRAVELAHCYEDVSMVVEVAGAPGRAEDLREKIRCSPLLRLAKDATERAEMRAYLLGARSHVREGDPVPQIGPVGRPTWAVVGADGQLAMPYIEDGDGAVDRMCRNLRLLSRYRYLLHLENHGRSRPLRDKFELKLLTGSPGGSFQEIESGADGRASLTEGDLLAFEVVNNYGEELYFSILDFGVTGRIELVYPPPGAVERLPDGARLQIGVREGEMREVFIPPELPFLGSDPGEGVDATAYIKVFASRQEADFSFLRQEGIRGRGVRRRGWTGSLDQLLGGVEQGYSRRDTRLLSPRPDDLWDTVVRTLSLRRNVTGSLQARTS